MKNLLWFILGCSVLTTVGLALMWAGAVLLYIMELAIVGAIGYGIGYFCKKI
jgi:hypothetical protein